MTRLRHLGSRAGRWLGRERWSALRYVYPERFVVFGVLGALALAFAGYLSIAGLGGGGSSTSAYPRAAGQTKSAAQPSPAMPEPRRRSSSAVTSRSTHGLRVPTGQRATAGRPSSEPVAPTSAASPPETTRAATPTAPAATATVSTPPAGTTTAAATTTSLTLTTPVITVTVPLP